MQDEEIILEIQRTSTRIKTMDDLDKIVQAVGDREIVLLGEASHGTSEFYTLRAEITKRLIQEKGFSFIAVEGDWPSCFTLNRYIKHKADAPSNAREALKDFNRWPTWMWANEEVVDLTQWLHEYNKNKKDKDQIGFYGIDVYSLWESMEEIIRHLTEIDSPDLAIAQKAFECFEPHGREPQAYGVSASFLSEGCEEEGVNLLLTLQEKRKASGSQDELSLNDEINALVAVNAERYYQSMVRGGPDSWNIRDRHMVEALSRIKAFHGPHAKAIVWEHNTHIGDARATDMAADGMVNVGQLVREKFGQEQVYAVGFGTYQGTVIASDKWGGDIEVMKVPQAISGSWEALLHQAGDHDKVIIFDEESKVLHQPLGHRAIGVVYHPHYERGNYVPSILPSRYDAFIYVDQSRALKPLKLPVMYY
ncbi:erythromycin esterase family protein [Paenibacillus camelliae]|uniref:erythromycin esterase family protein n=1 Tax=Paenibacillus camelliae TaxID=512410 RepID=UPI00203B8EF2|nr:erythromycin esterase family protein [Paenibacillus camelliae]MCM3633464.1 erythromycin esterase family protein [Paenibacillus camelliae]